jgi:hypothetical protein
MEGLNWIILALGLIIAAQLLIRLSQKSDKYDYSLKPTLLSRAERSFYGVLLSCIDDSMTVFSKVRVADVLGPKKGYNRKNWQTAFNKISSKHFDFVLCKTDDLSVVCAIELDDKSHRAKKRQARDSFLQQACDSADLSLIRVPAKRSYNKQELAEQLGLIQQKPGTVSPPTKQQDMDSKPLP